MQPDAPRRSAPDLVRMAEAAVQRVTGLEAFPQPPLVKTRHPIVFLHGFGLSASFRRGGHLHEEAMNLRLHGVLAYAPNVSAYHNVSERAAMWKRRLDVVLEESGAERLNLVAHSMGGLDARYLISRLGYHPHVASLTTVSTPHHGSSLAAFVLKQPQQLRSLLALAANWLGTTLLHDAEADALAALAELTPEYVRDVFNPATPDHPGVRYGSFAGVAGKGTRVPLPPLLRPFNGYIYDREGVNDGFVSEQSAQWGTVYGTALADHGAQVGLHPSATRLFDANAFYVDLARRLGRDGL